jgi:hypothetical protein
MATLRMLKRPVEQTYLAKKAYTIAKQIGLTDEDRRDLALMVPGVDPDTGGSWKALSDYEFARIVDMLEGYLLVAHLLHTRKDH